MACEVPALGKDEVADSSTETHRKEQPAVECHHYEHENVAIGHLNHVKNTLKNVHAQAQTIVAKSAQERVCVDHRCGGERERERET